MNEIQALEWANYAASRAAAEATPGLDLLMREDLVLTCSEVLPLPDANHACLLRTEMSLTQALIEEVVEAFHARGIAASIYLSPACAPEDLAARLVARGFVALPEQEAWMILSDLPSIRIPKPTPGITVRAITPEEVVTFADVYLTAFGMDTAFAPPLVELLGPSIGPANTHHYLALSEGAPVGTLSLLLHERFGVLGSAGVIRSPNSRGAATNMVITAALEARARGCDTLMLQTTAGTMLERFLRIRGFRRAFNRTCYMLPC